MEMAYLEEALDKVFGQSRLWVLLGTEVFEDVSELLPEVEGFLNTHGVNGQGRRTAHPPSTWYS
jgi:hypothetical protein